MTLRAKLAVPGSVLFLGDATDFGPDSWVELDPVVPTGESTFYLWVHGSATDPVVRTLREQAAIGDLAVLDEYGDRALVRFEWDGARPRLCELLDARSGLLVSAEGTEGRWLLQVAFPDRTALGGFLADLRERDLPFELLQAPGLHDDGDPLGPDVSDKQFEALRAAFEAGYFDVPRRSTLEELAAELGISEQGVSERLRRGLATVLDEALAEDGSGDEWSPG